MKGWSILLPLIVVLAGSAVHVFFGQAGRSTSIHARGIDDAYISFRYAENLARGEGLVYNPDERVEGYSNFLHVLVAAAFLLMVDRDHIFLAISLFNMAVLAVGIVYFHRRARERSGARRGLVAAMLLALSPPLWAWAASGMETIGVLVLEIWIWHLVESWAAGDTVPRTLPVALGLLVFARTDGFVVAAIIVVFFLWRRDAGRALRAGALAAPFVLLLFAARWIYYGRLWPNTYHTHVSGPLGERLAKGIELLVDVALGQGLLLYLLVVLFAFGWQVFGRRRSFGPFFATALVTYWLYIGGDYFVDRFLLLVIPIGIVTLLDLFPDEAPRAVRAILVALALAVQLLPLATNPRFLYGTEHYDGWITLGKFLGERYEGVRLAVDAAGKIPFFSGLHTLDMRGLTDPHVASLRSETFAAPGHTKVYPDYVIAKRPQLIATWIGPDLDAAAGLIRERYLAAGYRIVLLANASPRSRDANVLEVSGWSDRRLTGRIRDGYRLAVLEWKRDR